VSTVLVIGASRGIGLEFARQYREAGARVIATARDDAGLARLKALGAQPLRLDVGEPASISAMARQLDGEKIDVALYVAGVYTHGDAKAQPTREAFDQAMHTNVLGAMQTIPQVAPLVEAAAGCFAFMSSGMGQIGEVASSHGWTYRVSKAALNMAVAAARHDYPGAIMVALCPGWVRTDLGGPQAPLSVQESVSAMRATLASLTREHNGMFLQHDGRPYPSW